MKKITVPLIFAVALMIGFQLMVTHAGAEPLNFKLVSMIEKIEMVKVTQTEGVRIGVMDRKGLGIFENGEIATICCRGTFDTKKGFQGYSSLVFADGSTILLSWKGPTSQSSPEGGKFRGYTIAIEFADGTGRFKGIKGTGTYTAKEPQWDDEYKAKGFALYEFSGNYTLAAQ
jgi:hypothetical protein